MNKEILSRSLPLLVVGAVVLFIFWYGGRGQNITRIFTGNDTPRKVEPGKIIDVLPKNRIPSIDNPRFESASSADTWLSDTDIIFGLDYRGVVRAYPQKILNWHEIVNDTVAGDPITVTFCPLCGSTVAFLAVLDGKPINFGVSGKLYNSDLVMYNRDPNPAQESLWSQITGEAIVGVHTGKMLEQVSIDTTTWGRWKKAQPKTQVLSRESGGYPISQYDIYPYGDYESSRDINFPVAHRDTRLHEKAVVYGIRIKEATKAYPEEKLAKMLNQVIRDDVGGVPLELRYDGKTLLVKNLKTGENIIPGRNFWFAWVAFFPETELY